MGFKEYGRLNKNWEILICTYCDAEQWSQASCVVHGFFSSSNHVVLISEKKMSVHDLYDYL